jgi:hypothetical protein
LSHAPTTADCHAFATATIGGPVAPDPIALIKAAHPGAPRAAPIGPGAQCRAAAGDEGVPAPRRGGSSDVHPFSVIAAPAGVVPDSRQVAYDFPLIHIRPVG